VTLVVLLILAVIWAAVLLPPYLQNRSESRPADSISSFQKQLSVLERRAVVVNPNRPMSAPAARPYRPAVSGPAALRMSRSEARKRRRDVLFTLAGAAGVTLLLALVLGGPVWGLQLACDALLGGYVWLLAQTQQRVERDDKVRYLPTRQVRTEPALLLRRSGS
jgi:membrane protein implicated in regulation of membrane protease activity